jgi:SAM-dependent methyltransferase
LEKAVEMSDKPPGAGHMNFGDFRRTSPIDDNYGLERGTPIDRSYIERFLERHRANIAGAVLEMGEPEYSRMFGAGRIVRQDVLHLFEGNKQATIVGDLAAAGTLPSAVFDCIIVTQVLQYIYDVQAAVRNLHAALRPRGVILATLPGITRIDRAADWSGVQQWSFAAASAARLFGDVFGSGVAIEQHGNVLAAVALLHGLTAEDVGRDLLAVNDLAYPVIITVRAVKSIG